MQGARMTSPARAGAPAQQAAGMSKRPSKKWTEQEQLLLLSVVNAQGIDKINWAHVAKSLPGRTGKQCREKWKNDLRPDIFKDPWNRREEYILARLHSEVGNQWAEIAKYLPGRSENSIKNHWNATLRSKAEAKGRTLLGLYGRVVVEQQGSTSIKAFQAAVAAYQTLQGVDGIEMMQVSEDFFQRRPSSSNSPVRVKIGRSRGPAAPGTKTQAAAARGAAAARKRGRYDLSDSESLSDPEMDGDGSLCDDGTDEASETHVSRRRRSSAGGPASRRSSEVASGSAIPSVSCLGYAYAEMVNGRMHGDATATIKLSGPSQAKKGGPLPPHSRSFYMYPPPSGHYMPHAIPYPMSYGAGAPVAPMYPLHAENSLPPDTTQQVETGPRVVQVAGEWQNASGFDLDDDHQDLGNLEGWSTAELEMLRGIADFADDAVCTAGSAEDLSQPAAASPGSAATMAAPASPSACSDLLQGRGRSGDMVPGMPVPVAECGQYRGPDCGQYKAVDGYHPEPSWKEEPREAAPVGYQTHKASAVPHGRTYMMPSSQGAPMAWVAEGMPAAPPVDPRYVERHYYHPADAAGVYAACDEYGAHGCDCSAIPERQHSGVVMAERQYSTSAMVDRQYSNDAYEQYYAYPGHNYHQQPSHAHAHHQAPPHHQHPHPHHHYHHQHSQHQHHQQAVMVPAAPMYMKQEDEAYAAKPWPAQAATPAQQHLSTPAPVAVPEAHERAGNGSEAGPWIGMSPSDYCLPGLDCAGSPVLRGLDDLVEHML